METLLAIEGYLSVIIGVLAFSGSFCFLLAALLARSKKDVNQKKAGSNSDFLLYVFAVLSAVGGIILVFSG